MFGKVLVICGATASGKTALAIECAKRFNGEIISADALLVYNGLNIGTAKPTEEEKDGIVHHLIDVVSPNDSFSVSDYERLALPIVERLLKEGKTPIICGGTGFYVQSLLYKSQFGGAGADIHVRQKYEKIYEEKGAEYVHSLLREVDAESAEKLHYNDVKRVIRALEIYEVTGKPKSAQKDEQIPRFPFVAVSIDYPRETLYERINLRVEQMFANGLLQEVQGLMDSGVLPTAQCMQGIGYKEIIEGMQIGASVQEMIEMIQKNTRNYAKRQLTFFKRMQNHYMLSPSEATAGRVEQLLNS